MAPERQRRLVAEAPVARLATVAPDGRPHLVPICFALEGDTLWSAIDDKPKSARRPQRLRNVEREPRVAVLVDHYEDDWSRLWWVRLRGRGRIVAAPAERERALRALARRYLPYRERPPSGELLAVEVDEWRGWSAS
jgi:PPOX class probable F420-dependent enzyme